MNDETAVKLHNHNGVVWYANGMFAPRPSGYGVAQFCDSVELPQDAVVRVLGLAENAPLILALQPQVVAGRVRIEVAGPQVCAVRTDLKDPEIVLLRMRQCLLNSSAGGWHAMTAADLQHYQLVQEVANGTATEAHLHAHPAWPALSFVGNLDVGATLQLLSVIIDPRWHTQPSNPERSGRLRMFLGLVSRYHTSTRHSSPAARRSQLVRQAWSGTPPTQVTRERPEFFLWRHYYERGETPVAALAASSRFVSYLRHTWLDAIYRNTPLWPLFSPSKFFVRQDEPQAYVQHVQAYLTSV